MKGARRRGLCALGAVLGVAALAQNLQVGGSASYYGGSQGYYQNQVGEQPAYAAASGGCSYDRNSNTRIKPPKGTIVVSPDGH